MKMMKIDENDEQKDVKFHNFLHKICHMKMMGFDDNDEVGSGKKGWGLGKEGREGGVSGLIPPKCAHPSLQYSYPPSTSVS
jgi:hypothetical protein